jgi:hypothetical protein
MKLQTAIKTGIFAVLLSTMACSSWELKERCERTNWFEYAQKVAFDGKYLEEDGFIKDCKGVDRTSAVQLDLGFKQGREKMCQYDEIYSRAREGIPVFFKFCDGLEMNRMKSLYQQGLVSYCTAEKGYSFAKEGKVYQNLCNPQQEKAFLPAYYKGRKEYLTNLIAELQTKIVTLKGLEQSYALSEENINREYFGLPAAMECSTRFVYSEASKHDEAKMICAEAGYIRSRRTSLWMNLDAIRSKRNSVRTEWRDNETKITQAKADLATIPQ